MGWEQLPPEPPMFVMSRACPKQCKEDFDKLRARVAELEEQLEYEKQANKNNVAMYEWKLRGAEDIIIRIYDFLKDEIAKTVVGSNEKNKISEAKTPGPVPG